MYYTDSYNNGMVTRIVHLDDDNTGAGQNPAPIINPVPQYTTQPQQPPNNNIVFDNIDMNQNPYQYQQTYYPQPMYYQPQEDDDLDHPYGKYPPIFGPHARIQDQYYYQKGYNYNPDYVDEFGRPIPLRQSQTGYYSYYQQNQIMQQELKNHNDTVALLRKIRENDVNNKLTVGLTEEEKKQQQEQLMLQEKHIQANKLADHLYCLGLNPYNSNNPNYFANPVAVAYVNNWNKLHNRYKKKYPENMTMQQFFNEGYGQEQYYDYLRDRADAHARKLNLIFDPSGFRNTMAKYDPYYDPVEGIFKRKELCMDDLTITLPSEIKNSDYNKRRERFISAILSDD